MIKKTIKFSLVVLLIISNIFILMEIATIKKLTPDKISNIKYLDLILSLQYLHFPPKNV